MGDDVAIAILGIEPDVMRVAAHRDLLERFASIDGAPERRVGDVHLVAVVARDLDSDVVTGAADESAVIVHGAPVVAAVVRAPDRPLIRRLDEGVDPVRIGRGDRDVDLAEGRVRQSRTFDPLPGGTRVVRDENA